MEKHDPGAWNHGTAQKHKYKRLKFEYQSLNHQLKKWKKRKDPGALLKQKEIKSQMKRIKAWIKKSFPKTYLEKQRELER